jgi:hypothetical protein
MQKKGGRHIASIYTTSMILSSYVDALILKVVELSIIHGYPARK